MRGTADWSCFCAPGQISMSEVCDVGANALRRWHGRRWELLARCVRRVIHSKAPLFAHRHSTVRAEISPLDQQSRRGGA
eukprot:2895260-Pleurochrysis_carterae.AAC.1